MAKSRRFRPAEFGAARQDAAHKIASTPDSGASQVNYCVYNQTRGHFVATDVEAVDTSAGGVETRLQAMEQGAGTGLWILPYVEISPTSIRLPVDLVFLNNDGAVLSTVESFPLASPVVSSDGVWSVLVLPANTLAQAEIRAGDRLIISPPADMVRHLQKTSGTKAEANATPGPVPDPFVIAPAGEQTGSDEEEPAPGAVAPEPAASIEAAPIKAEIAGGEVAGTEELAASPPGETDGWKKKLEPRNWFMRLLLGDHVDPRRAPRESPPGLITYFFTGGTPAGEPVRDISATGMFIVTVEHWYPGTVVRFTLTDQNHPTADRTLTVNAKAVRRGSDGEGLEFVLEEEDQKATEINQTEITQLLERTLGVNHARVQAFLRTLKIPPSQE